MEVSLFFGRTVGHKKSSIGVPTLFNQHYLEEGLKRYAPTRNMQVIYSDYGRQLNVSLIHKYGLTDKKVKELIEIVRARIIDVAKAYGWDTWVPVQLWVERSLFEKVGNMYHPRDRIPLKIYWWKGHGKPELL